MVVDSEDIVDGNGDGLFGVFIIAISYSGFDFDGVGFFGFVIGGGAVES
ncbi:hypothetical protein BTHERMOSOX_1815 [Bathymodiolus thermophilus thioautotrophic gill symbiont]|nr:hypothetical protein BTHERMOSOX_1815 [Bathymodiolus thermophilus thioautotrophic gill symbiont]